MSKRKTTEEFIQDAKKVHGNKYDYSLVDYKNTGTKIKIICSEHGVFKQTPNRHLSGCICKKCSVETRTLNTAEFIERAKIIHKDKYDYSLVCYHTAVTKIKIICPVHGEFEQKPYNHLNGGCEKCNKAYKLTNDEFIKKSKEIHKNKYDYSLCKYINNRTKVRIICPIHGEFEQLAANHLKYRGCKKCDVLNRTTTLDDFKIKANKVHNNKYDYSLVRYHNTATKVKIICPIHGIFEQSPNNHTSQKQGCPMCKNSYGELCISEFLEKRNIKFSKEHKFVECKHKNPLPFDFYLPIENICIEFDGLQHFEPNEFFGGFEGFKKLLENDKIKNEYCKNNNIRLVRIRYDEDINMKLENLNFNCK